MLFPLIGCIAGVNTASMGMNCNSNFEPCFFTAEQLSYDCFALCIQANLQVHIMSGGRLVVLDRLGRDVKSFPLPQGLATIGSDQGCDICILLPTVSPHHATVVVHAYQVRTRFRHYPFTLYHY